MPTTAKFLLDSNVFIEPKNTYYPFDLVPGYWDFLSQEIGGPRIRSITHVYDELAGFGDDLSVWIKSIGRQRFDDCLNDGQVFSRYLEVSQYVSSLVGTGEGEKRQGAIDEFLKPGGADPWLVAHASVFGETVVTREASRLQKLTKVSLVDVCKQFSVNCVNERVLLRTCGVKFGLIAGMSLSSMVP